MESLLKKSIQKVRLIRGKSHQLWIGWRWSRALARNGLPADFKLGDWSIPADDLMHLEQYLEGSTKKKLIVAELGSGASTVFLLKVLARIGKQAEFFSFDGDKNWITESLRLVKQFRCDLSPLSLQHVAYRDYGEYTWFDADSIQNALRDRKIDFLLVDAPPGEFPYSREPAVAHLWRHLAADSTVLLHDAKRPEEKAMAKQWSNYFYEVRWFRSILGMVAFSRPRLNLAAPNPITFRPYCPE